MKQKSLLIILSFSFLALMSCQEKSKKNRSNSSTDPALAQCAGQAYWTTPGCAGYCQHNPSSSSCSGTTGTTAGGTGTTAGGTIGGTTGGVTPPGTTIPIDPNWGVHYPGGVPTGTCSAPYLPSGLSSAYDTRKGTVTIAGLSTGSIEYSPFSPDAPNYLNTSPMLKSVSGAKSFFMTDSSVKVRFKVKPQPQAASTDTMCYGRNMPGSTIPGYTKLQYYIKIYGVSSSNAVTYLGTLGPYITGVNSCSQAIDLSYYKQVSPTGMVITIDQVKANQNCSSWEAGFKNCNAFKNVRSFDCWSMDIEVAADGTKTFD